MLHAGQVLGDFQIVKMLGKGGMGEVYEAQQHNPRRSVALKVLSTRLVNNDQARERFQREIEVLADLQHTHIVRIITSGSTPEDLLYYTMDLVQGVTLAQFLLLAREDSQSTLNQSPEAPSVSLGSQESTLSAEAPAEKSAAVTRQEHTLFRRYHQERFGWVIEVGLAIARALSHAHQRKILHRDIKPSNVMITPGGHVAVLDFGLYRALAPEDDSSTPGMIRGTPYYMSPEQAQGLPLDQRSDLYALGVTLYELLTGGDGPYPAPRSEPHLVLQQITSGQITPLRQRVPNLPAGLESVLRRCLCPHADRWPDADSLVSALTALQRTPLPPVPRQWLPWTLATVTGFALAVGLLGRHLATPEPEGHCIVTSEPPPAPQPVPARPVDPDYPESLLNRPRGIPVALQRLTGEPLYRKKLMGLGGYQVQGGAMLITAPPPRDPAPCKRLTLFTLDDDPKRRPYELTLEVGRLTSLTPKDFALGVFFGRREPTDYFFLARLEINETPRRWTLGAALIHDADDLRGQRFEMMKPLAGAVPLALPQNKERHKLLLRVFPEKIHLVVDDGPTLTLNVDELRRETRDPAIRESLRTDGALGVWATGGVALFQKAQIADISLTP